jgi:uncharacterized small protein (DUF1192 family)
MGGAIHCGVEYGVSSSAASGERHPASKVEAKMDWDEPKAKSQSSHTVGEPLDKLSKDELEGRLKLLEGEIARLKAELEQKKKHEAAAAELFSGKS